MKTRSELFLVVGLSAAFLLPFSCASGVDEIDPVYRQYMREFVQDISGYAKNLDPDFFIIPQNGQELFAMSPGIPGSELATEYLNAIDGSGREDLFYGYSADNTATPGTVSDYLVEYLNVAKQQGVSVLVTDYCSSAEKISDSYARNSELGYVSFAATHRELDNIPAGTVFGSHVGTVNHLSDVRNFLYLINPSGFSGASDMISAIADTNYDLVLLDLFFDDTALNSAQLDAMRTKENGGQRLLIAYMSIGEAEDYRWYWQPGWTTNPPGWLSAENENWEGNYYVEYWNDDWQALIYGSPEAYLDRIMAAGFDGVYLDIIEGYEYFE